MNHNKTNLSIYLQCVARSYTPDCGSGAYYACMFDQLPLSLLVSVHPLCEHQSMYAALYNQVILPNWFFSDMSISKATWLQQYDAYYALTS